MNKKLLFSCVLALLFISALSYLMVPRLSKMAIEYYLKTTAERNLNATIQYDTINHNGDYWVVENLRLLQGSKEILTAQTMQLSYQVEFLKANIHVNIIFIQPSISLGQLAFSSYSTRTATTEEISLPKFGIFSVTGKLDVDEGLIALQDSTDEQLLFQLKGDWSSSPNFYFRTWQKNSRAEKNQLSIIFTGKEGQNVIEAELKSFDCSLASYIIDMIWPSLNYWRANEGVISGRIIDRWVLGGKPTLIGELRLQQFRFQNTSLNITGNIPHAHLLLHENGGELKFIKPITLSYTGLGEYQGASAILSGGTLFFPNQAAQFSFDGEFLLQKNPYPIHITGHLHSLFSEEVDQLADILFETRYRDLPLTIAATASHHSEGIDLKGDLSSHTDHLYFDSHINVESASADMRYHGIPWLLNITDFHLKNGKFKGESLPITHYEGLFTLFPIHVDGLLNIEGTFDSDSLVANYDIADLIVENSEFLFKAQSLDPSSTGLPAKYHYHFATGEQSGTIPLSAGLLIDKTFGTQFSDIKTHLNFGKNTLSTNHVEGYWEDLFLSGNFEAKNLESDAYELAIKVNNLSGKLTQIQDLFKRLKMLNMTLPLVVEGEFMLRPEGALLNILKRPNSPAQVQASLHGALIDGTVLTEIPALSLHELSYNIDFDAQTNSVKISDIQGVLLLGAGKQMEEYQFNGDYLRINNLFQISQVDFDFWIGDKNRDILRIAGKTEGVNDSKIALVLDSKLSHLGNIHPEAFEIIFKNGLQLASGHVRFDLNLSSFLHDMEQFSKSAMTFLPKFAVEQLQHVKSANGILKIALSYDDHADLFSYQVTGKELSLGKNNFKELYIKGDKKGETWVIEQLQLDQLIASVDLSVTDRILNINFLGMQVKDAFLIGLQGKFFPALNRLEANVNLFEVELDSLSQWPILTHFVEQFKPRGNVKATGKLIVDQNEKKAGWNVDANLTTSWHDWGLGSLAFSDAYNVLCRISSKEGIQLKQMDCSLLGPEQTSLAALKLSELDYDFRKHQVDLNGLHFDIEKKWLEQFVKAIENYFPLSTVTQFNTLSQYIESNLKGTVSYNANPDHHHLSLTLEPSNYQILGVPYAVSKLNLDSDPLELRVNAECQVENIPWSLELRSSISELESSSLICQNPFTNPLYVYWHRNPKKEIVIQKIEGSSPGINVSLVATSENELEGNISINPLASKWILPKFAQQMINSWKIGGHFTLKGKLSLQKLNDNPIAFSGIIEGKDCDIGGCLIEMISGSVRATPSNISFENLHLTDVAGTITIKNMQLLQNPNGEWAFFIPQLIGSQIRPSHRRLYDTEAAKPQESTFVIKKLLMEDLSGNINDFSSFQGRGTIQCLNPPRRDLPNQIWKISSEEISAFSLNASLLSPVSGAVQFHLGDGKIYLDKFKDMYSAGKLSKFYLPEDQKEPFYIDFNGNLHVQVRMNHHSLFMKMAQLFTVAINGSLDAPVYTLLKQGKDE